LTIAIAKEFNINKKKLSLSKLLNFIILSFLEVRDIKGLYSQLTSNAKQR